MSVTVLDALEDLDRELAQRGIVLHLAGLPDASATVARKAGWYAQLEAEGRAHSDIASGLAAASA